MTATEQALNNPQKIRTLVQEKVEAERAEFSKPSDQADHDTPQFTSDEIFKALGSNEDGDAWVFIELHRGQFCYDHAARSWHKWAGHYWGEDLIDQATASIQRITEVYGKEAQRQAWERLKAEKANQAEKAKKHQDKETALLKRIRALQGTARKANVLHLAKVGRDSLAITGQEWDQDPWLLACRNGVIDLRTGNHRPGRPEDCIKTVAPTEWQSIDALGPIWSRFLDQIFDGDSELIAYVQRLFGYAITGKTTEHIHPIFFGQGRNGKGTLLEALHYVLGDIAGPIEAEMLLDQSLLRRSGGPTSDIMALKGKRLVWASETTEGRHLNAGKLKWLTGGDTLTGRAPYGKRQVTFKPTHTLFLLTNHRPHAPASDYALWQRIHLIPFALKFVDNPETEKERQRDPELPEKLKGEAPGILAWLVRGCLEWQRRGLNPPESVRTATTAYRQDEDLIGHFFNDCCIIAPNTEVKAGRLYKIYKKWCEEMGHRAMSGTRFGKEIKGRFNSYKTRQGVFYMGLGLTTIEDEV